MITATLAAAIGTGIYEARQASNARAQIETLKQQQVPLHKQVQQLSQAFMEATNQIAGLHQDNERLNRNSTELLKLRGKVSLLQRNLQEMEQSAGAGENGSLQTLSSTWLNRIKIMKQRIAGAPYWNIPELLFLSFEDWLRIAASRNFETDVECRAVECRAALTELRMLAKYRFGNCLSKALKAHAETSGGKSLSDVFQLKPYFEQAVEDSALARYEIVAAKDFPSEKLGGDWYVIQRLPLDDESDGRMGAGSGGTINHFPR